MHGDLHLNLKGRGTINLRFQRPGFPEWGRWHYYAILSTPTGGALWLDGRLVRKTHELQTARPAISKPSMHLLCSNNKNKKSGGCQKDILFAHVEYHPHLTKANLSLFTAKKLPSLANVPAYAKYVSAEHDGSCKYPGAFLYTDTFSSHGSCFLMTKESRPLCIQDETRKRCTKAVLVGHDGGPTSTFSDSTKRLAFFTMLHKTVDCTKRDKWACQVTKEVRCYGCTHTGYTKINDRIDTDPIRKRAKSCLGDPTKHASCAAFLGTEKRKVDLAKFGVQEFPWTLSNAAWKDQLTNTALQAAQQTALTE